MRAIAAVCPVILDVDTKLPALSGAAEARDGALAGGAERAGFTHHAAIAAVLWIEA